MNLPRAVWAARWLFPIRLSTRFGLRHFFTTFRALLCFLGNFPSTELGKGETYVRRISETHERAVFAYIHKAIRERCWHKWKRAGEAEHCLALSLLMKWDVLTHLFTPFVDNGVIIISRNMIAISRSHPPPPPPSPPPPPDQSEKAKSTSREQGTGRRRWKKYSFLRFFFFGVCRTVFELSIQTPQTETGKKLKRNRNCKHSI